MTVYDSSVGIDRMDSPFKPNTIIDSQSQCRKLSRSAKSCWKAEDTNIKSNYRIQNYIQIYYLDLKTIEYILVKHI